MTTEVAQQDWHGCYDSNWNNLIVPDAFAHPAKYAHGLIDRIFRFMLREDMLRRGDVVVDPFGGIATGGIVAASLGLQWFGCELEPKFHDLGNKNIAWHRDAWRQCGDPIPVLVNGDSRKLRENLKWELERLRSSTLAGVASANNGSRSQARRDAQPEYSDSPAGSSSLANGSAPNAESVSAVISSPPYNLPMSQDHNGKRGGTRGTEPSEHGAFVKYGNTPGQLEGLPMGDVDAVVSSPPYADGCRQTGGEDLHPEHIQGGKNGHVLRDYADGGHHADQTGAWNTNGRGQGQGRDVAGYGQQEGQLGQMKAGDISAVVTSPPYEGSFSGGEMESVEAVHERMRRNGHSEEAIKKATAHTGGLGYGNTSGQLGSDTGETFWHAARDIVSECHAILRPGGWSAWVVKDFVRKKARVPFCDDWCKLLEACGFVVKLRVHAMLVKETSHPDLFGGDDHVERTERKSFFRRLAEKKGSPRIDWEEVIFARKPVAD